MGLGLFLIPVLGGYLLLTRVHCTRFGVLRKSGYHLFFQSAIAGGVLVVVARLTVVFLNDNLPHIGLLWKSYVPIEYSGTVALSVLLGFMLPYVANLLYGKEKAERRTAQESGALIELVISESLDRQKPVELTLKNGKSYIGFALGRKIAAVDESDIALIPIKSGYRDKDTHELILTTDYISTIRRCLEDKTMIPDLRFEDFRVAIPMSEIRSVRIFHPEVYERFQQAMEPDGA